MNRPRILVVEDQIDNRLLVVKVLRRAGYEVIERDRAEGLTAVAHEQRPALILMDIELPGQSGLDAVRALRTDPQARTIPVIAVTAYAMRSDRQQCLDAGCAGYLSKPLDIDELVKAVREQLEGSRAESEVVAGDAARI
jgi:CheY-like chemotaxis protein